MSFKESLKESFKYACTPQESAEKKPESIEVGEQIKIEHTMKKPSVIKKSLVVVVVVLVAVYFYSSGVSPNRGIEIVKNSEIPSSPLVGMLLTGMPTQQNATIGSGISKIVGVDGTAEWESYRPDKYKDNSDIVCVQVIVKKTPDKGKKQTATFQFLLNESTKYIELGHFDVNGKPKSMLEATMALQYGIL